MKAVANKKHFENKRKVYNRVCTFLFVLFAYYLTAFYNKEFLVWAEEISLFLPTRLFFLQNMQTAGGLLGYCGTFLTQFYYYPFLGSTIFILCLVCIALLTFKTFEIPEPLFPLAFIPAIVLLASLTEVGYILYPLKSPGYLYSNSAGIMVCLSGLFLYKKIRHRYIRFIAGELFIILTYPLFGAYTLFAGVLCMIYEWVNKRENEKTPALLARLLLYSFTCLLLPYLYSRYIYTQMPYSDLYIAGLPSFFFTQAEFPLWIPFILLFLSLLLFTLFWRGKPKQSKFPALVSWAVFLLFLTGTYAHSFRNENFKTELEMIKAGEENDWEKVVSLGKNKYGSSRGGKSSLAPTRLIIMEYNLALYKLGIAGDQLFSIDNNSILQDNLRKEELVLMHSGAKPLYFQYGKINYCYRWCMEDMVEYGMTVQDLKYLTKCALMNEEPALAQKYNRILKQTLFHKDWANQYQRYIDDRSLMEQNAEFQAIRPLMAYQDLLDGDGGKLEVWLLNSFAFMQGGPPELVELSIQCNLILKNIERFWPRFFLYARTHDRIPVHYQEAAILYAHLEGKVAVDRLPLDKKIVERFDRLVTLSKQYANRSEEYNKKAFKPQFGDTFWYYYFFVTGIKTN